ncbi:Trm112 family protein [Candidatus Blochmanniella vafra]|uniref:Trm112 family protein n=1 Tax=Candidatus Blochmanniella vafra TaxID=251535 RepID=UPI0005C53784|nr:Trm112 family protein [Candidatus Blochmannia vafer]
MPRLLDNKKKLLEIIVCPICHKKLFLNLKKTKLICFIDKVFFPIKEGIPVLLKNSANKINKKL